MRYMPKAGLDPARRSIALCLLRITGRLLPLRCLSHVAMRRCIGHSSPSARRTPQEPLTGKRQEAVVSAVLASMTQKTPRQDAAIQAGAEFPFDKIRNSPVTLLLSVQERFEL